MSLSQNNNKGLKLKTLIIMILIVSAVVSLMMPILSNTVIKNYASLNETVTYFRKSQTSGTEIRTASDYMTQQAKNFVTTGAMRYLNQYYEEVEIHLRREKAFEEIKSISINDIAEANMESAFEYSQKLEEFEREAFLLALDYYGFDREDYPSSLKDLYLDESDAALSQEEKLSKAKELLFGNTYQAYKNIIISSTDSAISVMTRTIQKRYDDISKSLNDSIRALVTLSAISFITMLGTVIIIFTKVLNPISRMISDINEQNSMASKGLYEMRYLADTYNQMHDKITDSQQQIYYEATHDALTGILNRKAYSEVYNMIDDKDYCYILIDVDNFKHINDTYGHDAGDEVLKKMAQILNESFRNGDDAFRIGGDEFAVIMMGAGMSLRHVVESRVNTVIEKIKACPSEDLPEFSISVGVAFSKDEKSTGAIYKDADLALYEAKKDKNKVVFFTDLEEIRDIPA